MGQPPRFRNPVREAEDHSSVVQRQRTERFWPFTSLPRAGRISGPAAQNIDDSSTFRQEVNEHLVHRAAVGRMDPAHGQLELPPNSACLTQSLAKATLICVIADHRHNETRVDTALAEFLNPRRCLATTATGCPSRTNSRTTPASMPVPPTTKTGWFRCFTELAIIVTEPWAPKGHTDTQELSKPANAHSQDHLLETTTQLVV